VIEQLGATSGGQQAGVEQSGKENREEEAGPVVPLRVTVGSHNAAIASSSPSAPSLCSVVARKGRACPKRVRQPFPAE
jgi:hypothetical protein